MKKDQIFILILTLLTIALVVGLFWVRTRNDYYRSLTEQGTFTSPTSTVPSASVVNKKQISLEIADTIPKREKGLSMRETLNKDSAMLFVFHTPTYAGIWMKDMKFPLDILWLDKDYRITDIRTNIWPESFPEVFRPSQAVPYVLEANTGFVNTHNLKIGDTLMIKGDILEL